MSLPVAVINYPLGLAHRTFDALGGSQLDLGANSGNGLDLAVDSVVQTLHEAHLVRETLGSDLDPYRHLVKRTRAVDLDEIMRSRSVHAEQRLLDLRRKNVHATDDKHVVGRS